MDDEKVTNFTAITGSTPERARQYLQMSENSIQDAIELYFNMGGVDLVGSSSHPSNSTQAPTALDRSRTRPQGGVIDLDSDDDGGISSQPENPSGGFGATNPVASDLEDDAAMARRLQEELYGGASGSSGPDRDGYRAPIAPTRETLVGPESYDMNDPDEMHAAVLDQLRRRNQRGSGRPGIFNQQATGSTSIWNESVDDSERQAELSRATGGASERSSKSTMLAEMFRPPFELISRLSWDEAREEGKSNQKWILVNVQDPSIFDCQLLNRDIWKHEGIRETIKENFIFMQYSKDDSRGNQYMQYYFQDRDIDSAYPHIAIVDPRTGEQVKVWSGPPAPRAMDFLMQLHEFLDRYSLHAAAKNPVAKRKPEPRRESQVDRMTEEEQLEMALQESLAGASGTKEADPDDLTRSIGDVNSQSINDRNLLTTESDPQHLNGHGTPVKKSTFESISFEAPHVEPAADPQTTTRIQVRHPSGRVVRRFELSDSVRRIYEWLKAEPLDGMTHDTAFELVCMGKNLIDRLDETLKQASLQNATINLEIVND